MLDSQPKNSPSSSLLAQTACLWEATARKPGNVHRYADFQDATYLDFALSAVAIGPAMENAAQQPVGQTILQAVRATRQVIAHNTNLGIILLLAPLAAVQRTEDLRSGVERVLAGLTVEDARQVYEAIRLASPGGLGDASEGDVRDEPTGTLRAMMALAADRDSVARQYANGYQEVFDLGLPALEAGLALGYLEDAIIGCHLQLLAGRPDSLIARKRGLAEAVEASRRAAEVMATGGPRSPALADFDRWLCAEGHARNPGTTADLATACLFAALRNGILTLPVTVPWTRG